MSESSSGLLRTLMDQNLTMRNRIFLQPVDLQTLAAVTLENLKELVTAEKDSRIKHILSFVALPSLEKLASISESSAPFLFTLNLKLHPEDFQALASVTLQ